MNVMARCLVAFGSNLGERRGHLDRALELLGFMPGIRLLGVSRYRESVPIGGPAGQPPFLNGACLVETDLAPHDLLGLLQAVEASLERERAVRWGPRTVDLDLILYDGMVVESERLTVPHPRMATRRFVLEPSAEIAADLTHPTSGCSVGELLENISKPHPYVAVAGVAGTGSQEVANAAAEALFARLVHRPAALGDWREQLEASSRPLEPSRDGPARLPTCDHGTVSEYWLGSLRLAAARLAPTERAAFDAAYASAAARAMQPQVVLLLTVPREILAERIAYRRRPASGSSDLFRDVGEAAERGDAEAVLDDLVGEQDRLVAELQGRRSADAAVPADLPKAVVRIDTSDFGQAIEEAVAAVEAMG
jgi:2-amino-4-hydroxy-6-hydroxymethyldihydropteridine diphosphokinase